MSRGDNACKIYVGELDPQAEKREVEEAFAKIGPIKNVWVARNPPGFAFVEFEDPRDAQDACRHMDGDKIGDSRVRVEMSRGGRGGGRRGGDRGGGDRWGDGDRGGDRRDDYGRDRRGSPPRRSRYERSRSRSRDRRRSPSRERQPARRPASRSRSRSP